MFMPTVYALMTFLVKPCQQIDQKVSLIYKIRKNLRRIASESLFSRCDFFLGQRNNLRKLTNVRQKETVQDGMKKNISTSL